MLSVKKITIILSVCFISLIIAYLFSRVSIIVGAAFCIIPFVLVFALIVVEKPFYALIALYIANYLLMGLKRYVTSLPVGVAYDTFLIIVFLSLIFATIYRKVEWRRGFNFGSLLALVWLIYCIFEFFNPESISNVAWYRTGRGVALYFFVVVFFSSIICGEFKQVKTIMLVLGVLTLVATAKALMQKYYGFDQYEKVWLYRDGGYVTHIIYSGIRYFSIFSDAANFGATMGHAIVVFAGTAFVEKNIARKIFYIVVACAACYSLVISGSRSALIVPLAGIAVFVALSKNPKTIIFSFLALAAIIVFFRFTSFGQGNATIRRIRSAFFPSDDAAFVVRMNNQKLLKEYMADKPFGAGIGHGGVKAKEVTNNSYLSQIPTDSWYVMIWVETGIVGLIVNLLIMISIIIYSSYLIFFKVRNFEVRVTMASFLAGLTGIVVASYSNEIFGSFPIGTIIYVSIGFLMLSTRYDKQLTQQQQQQSADIVTDNG